MPGRNDTKIGFGYRSRELKDEMNEAASMTARLMQQGMTRLPDDRLEENEAVYQFAMQEMGVPTRGSHHK